MNEWFLTPLGQSVLSAEAKKCTELVPTGYYPHSLQIGFPWLDFVAEIENRKKYMVDVLPDSAPPSSFCENSLRVICQASALPFAQQSIDLAVLPHTLDFCRNPHEVLRQVTRVLVTEGCIVVVGFNLISTYGIIHLLNRGRKELPWSGRLYSVTRVQDWLSLLGYDVVGAHMMCYRPPIHSIKWRHKMSFMESAGARWTPGLGGVYAIVGKKRDIAMPPRIKVTGWRNLLPAMPQPVAHMHTKTTAKTND